MDKTEMRTSTDILNLSRRWENVKKFATRVPDEMSKACDMAVVEAGDECDEAIKQARRE